MKTQARQFINEVSYRSILRDNESNLKFIQYYKWAFNEDFCSACPGVLSAAYDRLYNFIHSNSPIIMKQTSQFRLKETSIIYDRISHRHVNNASLTDEIAFNLLMTNSNFISQFTLFPENWQELLKRHVEKIESARQAAKEEAEFGAMFQNGESNTGADEYRSFLAGLNKKALMKEVKKASVDASDVQGKTMEEIAEILIKKFSRAEAE